MNGTSGLMIDTAMGGGALLLLGTAGASLTVRLWRGRPYLAVAYGLLAIGLSGTGCFFAFMVSPTFGAVTARLALVAAIGVTGWWLWCTRRLLLAALRSLLAPALLLGGTALASLGLFALWHTPQPWFVAARLRWVGNPAAWHDIGHIHFLAGWLPGDNQIPAMLASTLWTHGDLRHAVGWGWQSSDRPPLEAGLLLFGQAVTHHLGSAPGQIMFATGVAAQLVWLPATYALLRALRLPRHAVVVALLFAAASGTVLLNTVFTWPKLVSAAFALAATAVLLELPRDRPSPLRLAAAAVLVVLAALSHGAAVFAVPLLLYAVVRRWRALSWRGVALAAGAAVLVYLPWVAYQKWYDPPGDRLLKWHLAGVDAETHTPFLTLLVRAYTHVPVRTIAHHKIDNFLTMFADPPWAGLSQAFSGNPVPRRTFEFFVVSDALGLAVLPMAGLLVWAVVLTARRGVRFPLADGTFRLLLVTAVCLVFWCLVMYGGPASTVVHQGSHVAILLLLTLPVAWCSARRPRATLLLLPVQFVILAVTYGPRGADDGALSPVAACGVAAGCLLVLAAVAVTARRPGAGRPAAHRRGETVDRSGVDDRATPHSDDVTGRILLATGRPGAGLPR